MKIHYDKKTGSLYLDLSPNASTGSEEIAPGIIIDFDKNNKPCGIDISNAKRLFDLKQFAKEILEEQG